MSPVIVVSRAIMFGMPLLISLHAAEPPVAVGVARIDITPELPIQLGGYQQRTAEATRVVVPLTARALAIGSDAEGPVVLIPAR